MATQADAQAHTAHKREAFDGMRAYHQSEIAHKQDGIEILKTLLTTAILIYGGLIGAMIADQLERAFALWAGVALFILTGVAAGLVVHITNQKIDADNARYRDYRAEYVAEHKLLGLDSDLDGSMWHREVKPEATASGYSHTKNILRVLGFIVGGAALVGTVTVFGVAATLP